MSKSPAFQFYPRDWLGDPEIMLMDWDARAMHLHCMCIAWMHDTACALPDDDEKLMRWLGVLDAKDWHNRLKPQIFSAWKKEDGMFVQSRLKREKNKQLQTKEAKRRAAETRWKNQKNSDDAHALHMQCPSTSTSTAVSKKELPNGSSKKAAKKTCKTMPPSGWQPSAKTREWFASQPYRFSIDDMTDEFVNGCRAGNHKYADHDAAFRNWSKKRHEADSRANNRGTESAADRFARRLGIA